MSIIPTIDQLRKDMESARNDVVRIEGQQESAGEELTALQAEAGEMGIAPKKLREEADRIVEDVSEAYGGVRDSIQALGKKSEVE